MHVSRRGRIAVLSFFLLAVPGVAPAEDLLVDADADAIANALDPGFSRTRGIVIVPAKNVTNSYGDTLAATVNLAVEFEFNSAILTDRAKLMLDALGEAINRPALADYRFVVGGHTDAVGSDSFNLDLSRRRAESTTRYLMAHFNVGEDRFVVRAFGKTVLLIPEEPADARNRRVEISTLSAEASE